MRTYKWFYAIIYVIFATYSLDSSLLTETPYMLCFMSKARVFANIFRISSNSQQRKLHISIRDESVPYDFYSK